jgi:hypothetical protein
MENEKNLAIEGQPSRIIPCRDKQLCNDTMRFTQMLIQLKGDEREICQKGEKLKEVIKM